MTTATNPALSDDLMRVVAGMNDMLFSLVQPKSGEEWCIALEALMACCAAGIHSTHNADAACAALQRTFDVVRQADAMMKPAGSTLQ
jgi:hypothetical protein